jgi:hypothetical protein
MEGGMSKIHAEHRPRPRKTTYRLAAFAALMAASGAAPCLAQDGASAAPAPAAALDPERLALANEVIDLAYPVAGRSALLMSAVDALMPQVRAALEVNGAQLDAGMEAIVERFFARIRAQTERLVAAHGSAIFSSYARAYARRFTRDELVEIRAFVSTPTGRRYVQESVRLLSDPDVARANTDYMTSVFSTMEPMQAELRRELQDYMRSRRERALGTPPRGTR